MQLKEIIKEFEDLVPKQIEWEKDNCGLQIGNLENEIKKILLCLDVNKIIVQEAKETKSDLIFSHHPFIFHPIKSINLQTKQGQIIQELISYNINLYSAHTNFDKYKEGINYTIGEILKLKNIKPLIVDDEYFYKIVTFAPENSIEKLINALSIVGAGKFGNYSDCSFQSKGEGTFKGNEHSNPYIGEKEKLTKVSETKIEMIFPKWKQRDIINALKQNHPYEEPAFDIIPLKNKIPEYGYGIVGELETEVKASEFLTNLKKILSIPILKVAGNIEKRIKKIAFLGGSGSSYIDYAITKNADIFITADLSYHNYFDYEDKIIIVDAGHFETEILGLNALYKVLNRILKDKVEIIKTKYITNPIIYF